MKEREAFEARYRKNERCFGVGIETSLAIPCPFCGAADLYVAKVIEFREISGRDHQCRECRRSSRVVYVVLAGSTTFEVVQSGGDDPPTWQSTARRVEPLDNRYARPDGFFCFACPSPRACETAGACAQRA